MFRWFRKGAESERAVPAETAVYRLRSWPELPAEYRTAPILRAFTRMSLGPVTLGLFALKSGMPRQDASSLLQTAVEAGATLAFALSGLLEAARKRLDAVGVCLVAGLAAFGGGTLRDILLDRRPFFFCAFAGAWVLIACEHAGVPQGWALVVGAAAATGLRVMALVSGYTLPRWTSGSDRQ